MASDDALFDPGAYDPTATVDKIVNNSRQRPYGAIRDAPQRPDGAIRDAPQRPDGAIRDARRHPEDAIRDAIVAGRLQPNQRLVEADLSKTLGVGRSAVRTALARLEHEGLVEHVPHRGSHVRLVAEREAVEILEARAALEGLAARHAAARATPADLDDLRQVLQRMRAMLDRGDLLGASDENAVLHRRLLDIAGHGTAARLIATLRSQLVRFQYRTILLPGRSEQSFAEHTAIVDAVAARDHEAAETAMRTHLANVAQALRQR